ncbi:MAG: hypothetical protein M3P18_06930 [Actinomycetota bacterium]|nr:hypothetical protein [Actinomycetota bacterium]
MTERLCPKCGKPEIRKHRHGADTVFTARYGRFTADQHRQWLRSLVELARRQIERSA